MCRQKNILVVDKHKVLSKYLKTFLEREGYKVFILEHIENMEQIAKKEKIDIIISDFNVKRGHDWDVVTSFKDTHKDTTIIAMSTSDVADVKKNIGGFYADGFLRKPFKVEELEKILNNISFVN